MRNVADFVFDDAGQPGNFVPFDGRNTISNIRIVPIKAICGVLDLNRVLDINALVDSGNGNGGNGITKNEVGTNQDYRQGVNEDLPEDNNNNGGNNNRNNIANANWKIILFPK